MGYGNDSRQTGPLSSQILHIDLTGQFAFYVETRTRQPELACPAANSILRRHFPRAALLSSRSARSYARCRSAGEGPADPILSIP